MDKTTAAEIHIRFDSSWEDTMNTFAKKKGQ